MVRGYWAFLNVHYFTRRYWLITGGWAFMGGFVSGFVFEFIRYGVCR